MSDPPTQEQSDAKPSKSIRQRLLQFLASTDPWTVWLAPTWSHLRIIRKSTRVLCNIYLWLRIACVSTAIGVFIIAAFKILLFPQLPLAQIIPLALQDRETVGHLLSLPFLFAFLLLCPEIVFVEKKRITIFHGDSAISVAAKEITAARLLVFAPNRLLLRIRWNHRGRTMSRTVGIRSRTNLDKFLAVSPFPVEVIDARQRLARFQFARQPTKETGPARRIQHFRPPVTVN